MVRAAGVFVSAYSAQNARRHQNVIVKKINIPLSTSIILCVSSSSPSRYLTPETSYQAKSPAGETETDWVKPRSAIFGVRRRTAGN